MTVSIFLEDIGRYIVIFGGVLCGVAGVYAVVEFFTYGSLTPKLPNVRVIKAPKSLAASPVRVPLLTIVHRERLDALRLTYDHRNIYTRPPPLGEGFQNERD